MVKNIIISFASIIGVFLLLGLLWLFAVTKEPVSQANQRQVEPTKVLTEIDEEEGSYVEEKEPVQNLDFFRSNLKIVNID